MQKEKNFLGGMGKRAWKHDFLYGLGKRAWNSGFTNGMGKRAWTNGFTSKQRTELRKSKEINLFRRYGEKNAKQWIEG